MRYFVSLSLVLGLVGCERATSQVELTIDGKSQTLVYGKATPEYDGLLIRLHAKSISCKDLGRPSDLAFSIEPGPGGRFYAKSPIGVSVMMHNVENTVADSLHNSAVVLEPITYATGQRVRGTIDFDMTTQAGKKTKATGSFDVEICESAGDNRIGNAVRQEAESSSGPVKGTFAGKPFRSMSAFVMLGRDRASGEAFVDDVRFSSQSTSCASVAQEVDVNDDVLRIYNIGGGRKAPYASPRPALPTMHVAQGNGLRHSVNFDGGLAWVRLEGPLDPGARVKGAVHASSKKAARADGAGTIGGEFEAVVCPMPRSR